MPVKPSDTLNEVKLAMMCASTAASNRQLTVLQGKSSCKSGCSACCSRMVYISLAEAIIIYQYLVDTKEWPKVKESAKTLMPLLEDAQPITWFQMNQACPVLDMETRKCKAYVVRPTSCSSHFVTSDAKLCDPWSTSRGSYQAVDFIDLHEEFITKLDTVVDNNGMLAMRLPMPTALLLAEKVQGNPSMNNIEFTEFIRSELT